MLETPPNGVVILDKPEGMGSNRALGRLKHMAGLPRRGKAGFLGTLDPLATGVLPVFIGKATKLIPAFEHLDKTYRVTIRLGQTTNTLDAEGTLVSERSCEGLSGDTVREAVQGFVGEMEQKVPEFSAVKIEGVPSYRLARGGKPIPQRVRRVTFHQIEVESVALPWVTCTLTCSPGTYVRALARDLGERLAVGGHVTALRRLACGTLFTLENCFSLEGIADCLAKDDWHWLVNPAGFLLDHQPLTVEEPTERQLREGRAIPLSDDLARLCPSTKVKALRPCGTLVAVGEVMPDPQGHMGFQPTKVLV